MLCPIICNTSYVRYSLGLAFGIVGRLFTKLWLQLLVMILMMTEHLFWHEIIQQDTAYSLLLYCDDQASILSRNMHTQCGLYLILLLILLMTEHLFLQIQTNYEDMQYDYLLISLSQFYAKDAEKKPPSKESIKHPSCNPKTKVMTQNLRPIFKNLNSEP